VPGNRRLLGAVEAHIEPVDCEVLGRDGDGDGGSLAFVASARACMRRRQARQRRCMALGAAGLWSKRFQAGVPEKPHDIGGFRSVMGWESVNFFSYLHPLPNGATEKKRSHFEKIHRL
jgi:hypothetical protein